MKRWLLLSLLPIALLLLAVGALSLRSSGEAQAGAVSGDPIACAAQDAGGALVTSVDGTSLTSSENAALAASCYFVGSDDLWIMRYLCYTPQKGWYYVNYFFCRD